MNEYIGKVFGELTILEELIINNGKRNRTYYKCQCICGIVKNIQISDIFLGKTKSCGCMTNKLIIEKLKAKIEGKRFGFLVAIENTGNKRSTSGYLWKCLCDCGNYIEVPVSYLKRGDTSSCGCKSKLLNSKNNSLAKGGTGIAGETLEIQKEIRTNIEYREWHRKCLELAEYKCAITGKNSNKLEVHHKDSISYLIKTYGVTKQNWREFTHILYNLNNGVVLEKKIHRKFHSEYGLCTTEKQFIEFFNTAKT